jgi:hypothetical protein
MATGGPIEETKIEEINRSKPVLQSFLKNKLEVELD